MLQGGGVVMKNLENAGVGKHITKSPESSNRLRSTIQFGDFPIL